MDTTTRALERDAVAAGDPAAQARWLTQRLRGAPACEACAGERRLHTCRDHAAGLLSCGPTCEVWRGHVRGCPACAGTGSAFRARLELAAWCGSDAARAVVGAPSILCDHVPSAQTRQPPRYRCVRCDETGGQPVDTAPLAAWLSGLSRWSAIHPSAPGWVPSRAAVAAARVALSRARRGVSGPGGQSMEACAAREAAHATVRAAHRAITAAEAWLDDPTEARWAAWHVAYVDAGHAAWLPPPGHDRSAQSIDAAARVASRLGVRSGVAAVRSAICSALVAWALA